MKTAEELYGMAFRMLHEVSEALKAQGVEREEVWALMFATAQDLQAADFGIGSVDHEEALRLQRDSLDEGLASLHPVQ